MNETVLSIANVTGLPPKVVVALGMIVATLLVSSILRLVAVRNSDSNKRRERLGSLAVWWIGFAVISSVACGGVRAGALFFALVSFQGLREYFRMLDVLVQDNAGRGLVYLAIPLTYAGVWRDDDWMCLTAVPIVGFMALSARLIVAGKTRGYLAAVGGLTWGAGLLVFLLAHAARLLALPAASNPAGGAAGWIVFLIVLTECDDIFQALWGRRFGRHKITPRISPNKSLEGLVGGVLSTLVMGVVLAPWLTPLAEPWKLRWAGDELLIPYCGAVLACLLISGAGFLGDLNMSALKRDAGVKDTGNWLPGQGGVLDRIDSLTFTAPAFYCFVRLCYA